MSRDSGGLSQGFQRGGQGSNPKIFDVYFVMENMSLGQVFLSVLRSSSVVRVPPVLLPILSIVTDGVQY